MTKPLRPGQPGALKAPANGFHWKTKTRGNDACTDSAGENNLIWQWSLSSITDIYGNQLAYNYQNEVKSQDCHNETAVYPDHDRISIQ